MMMTGGSTNDMSGESVRYAEWHFSPGCMGSEETAVLQAEERELGRGDGKMHAYRRATNDMH